MEFEALESLMMGQRAIRKYDGKPVDDALIEKVIGLATRAPSGGNRQPWHFIVVRAKETKKKLGVIFDELGVQFYGNKAPERTPWEDVPVLIAICSKDASPAAGASIYPAVQNLLLAAQALGLGTVLTTRWRAREPEVRPLLGVPDTMSVQAIIPMGWPDRRYGRGNRLPVAEITSSERFGTPWIKG